MLDYSDLHVRLCFITLCIRRRSQKLGGADCAQMGWK